MTNAQEDTKDSQKFRRLQLNVISPIPELYFLVLFINACIWKRVPEFCRCVGPTGRYAEIKKKCKTEHLYHSIDLSIYFIYLFPWFTLNLICMEHSTKLLDSWRSISLLNIKTWQRWWSRTCMSTTFSIYRRGALVWGGQSTCSQTGPSWPFPKFMIQLGFIKETGRTGKVWRSETTVRISTMTGNVPRYPWKSTVMTTILYVTCYFGSLCGPFVRCICM